MPVYRLENWRTFNNGYGIQVRGIVYGNPRFPDGSEIYTSVVQEMRRNHVVTCNSIYLLGEEAIN